MNQYLIKFMDTLRREMLYYEIRNKSLSNPITLFFMYFLAKFRKNCTFKKLNMPSFFARTEIDCVNSLSNGGLKGNPEAADTSIGRSCNGEMKEIRIHIPISFT